MFLITHYDDLRLPQLREWYMFRRHSFSYYFYFDFQEKKLSDYYFLVGQFFTTTGPDRRGCRFVRKTQTHCFICYFLLWGRHEISTSCAIRPTPPTNESKHREHFFFVSSIHGQARTLLLFFFFFFLFVSLPFRPQSFRNFWCSFVPDYVVWKLISNNFLRDVIG